MSTNQNKAVISRMYAEVTNKRDMALVDELAAVNVLNHAAPPGFPQGLAGYKQFLTMYLGAFPDGRITIDDQIAEGDLVVTRWTVRGTHGGDLFGIPPTGKSVTFSGITIDRLEGGKVTEEWNQFDQMGMMQQLGVVPAPGKGS